VSGRRPKKGRPASGQDRPFDQHTNDEWVEGSGRVVRLLADDDDEEGAHQRFVLRTPAGQSLLIAHNLDVAPRVPLGMADRIGFRGIYEWNDLGGTVHWTHHDPRGLEEGGWVEYRRRRYR
jgi:hypothetical protein